MDDWRSRLCPAQREHQAQSGKELRGFLGCHAVRNGASTAQHAIGSVRLTYGTPRASITAAISHMLTAPARRAASMNGKMASICPLARWASSLRTAAFVVPPGLEL